MYLGEKGPGGQVCVCVGGLYLCVAVSVHVCVFECVLVGECVQGPAR